MSITAETVRQLRERTGAGMMECKKALVEANGDLEAAAEIMRKSGLAKADKKAARVAAEGRIVFAGSADGRTGVLVEVNCETDFVARSEPFKAFVHDVAIQIAAMNPIALSRDTTPKDQIEKELEIYRVQLRNEGKKEEMIEKIATGKLGKYFQENCLLEQSFVKDATKTITDLLKEIGPNVTVTGFVRMQLGEGQSLTPAEA